MGLKSFFQRKDKDEAAAPARSRRGSAPPADATEAVRQARTRARQRLVGAVVLLGIGIIGFPLLFETQPRPIPVDLPIEIPRKEGAPPLQMPAPRPQPAPAARGADAKPAASSPTEIVETPADAGREVPPPASAPAVAAAPAPAASKTAKPAAAPKPVAEKPAAETRSGATKPPAAADDGNRAKALLEGKGAASASDAQGRFVVQVGAFAEVAAARETRLKVEKLGLKTYTQVVETDAGKRIRVRVGPFSSRDEADKAASRIKAAGLGSAVLTL